jgi:hypothetical protein
MNKYFQEQSTQSKHFNFIGRFRQWISQHSAAILRNDKIFLNPDSSQVPVGL